MNENLEGNSDENDYNNQWKVKHNPFSYVSPVPVLMKANM